MSSQSPDQPDLVRGLLQPSSYPFACSRVEMVETHISWVFLTGSYAYKVKKPVDMGFLDFTTLEKRFHYCQEEMRLNSRLAKDLYLAVVPISGALPDPQVEGRGRPFEYAVKMKEFDQGKLLSAQLERGELEAAKIDSLVAQAWELHQTADRASADDDHGTPSLVHAPCEENFQQLGELLQDPRRLRRLRSLEDWMEREYEELHSLLNSRKEQGFIRECHGDLHLGNVTEVDDRVVVFDGIEFNENFRWIDIQSEMAFLFTDLEHRGRRDLAWRALDGYLALSGDYEGLKLLRYYRLHRILVRAKVDSFRLKQPGLDEAELRHLEADLDQYLDQAELTIEPDTPILVLTRGLSGSGKSTVAQGLLEELGAVRLRSDVERKRLFGLSPQESSGSPLDGGIYTLEATERTFERLRQLAGNSLQAGYSVIVDATFLEKSKIGPFQHLAMELEVPFQVLDLRAPTVVLRARIAKRDDAKKDASEAGQEVLTRQLASYQPLDESYSLVVNAEKPPSAQSLAVRLRAGVAAV